MLSKTEKRGCARDISKIVESNRAILLKFGSSPLRALPACMNGTTRKRRASSTPDYARKDKFRMFPETELKLLLVLDTRRESAPYSDPDEADLSESVSHTR
jgi:hypothetical protein